MADNYRIEGNTVVYRGQVKADKDSDPVDVTWTFDFANVSDVQTLWKMAVEPSGLVVKAQARYRRKIGKDDAVPATHTFDVQKDFLETARPRKDKKEKVLEQARSMSQEEREALIASLQQADTQQEG